MMRQIMVIIIIMIKRQIMMMTMLMMRQVRARERHPKAAPRRGVTALFVMASLHSTSYILYYTFDLLHFTLFVRASLHSTSYILYYTFDLLHFALFCNGFTTFYILYSILYFQYPTLTALFVMASLHSTFYILYIQCPTFCPVL